MKAIARWFADRRMKMIGYYELPISHPIDKPTGGYSSETVLIGLYLNNTGKRMARRMSPLPDKHKRGYYELNMRTVQLWVMGGEFPKKAVYFGDTVKAMLVRLVDKEMGAEKRGEELLTVSQ